MARKMISKQMVILALFVLQASCIQLNLPKDIEKNKTSPFVVIESDDFDSEEEYGILSHYFDIFGINPNKITIVTYNGSKIFDESDEAYTAVTRTIRYYGLPGRAAIFIHSFNRNGTILKSFYIANNNVYNLDLAGTLINISNFSVDGISANQFFTKIFRKIKTNTNQSSEAGPSGVEGAVRNEEIFVPDETISLDLRNAIIAMLLVSGKIT